MLMPPSIVPGSGLTSSCSSLCECWFPGVDMSCHSFIITGYFWRVLQPPTRSPPLTETFLAPLSYLGRCGQSLNINAPLRTFELASFSGTMILITAFYSFIHWSALAFAILSVVWVLKAVYGVYNKSCTRSIALTDEERGPLLPGH